MEDCGRVGGVCDDHFPRVISLACCEALVFCRHPDKSATSPSPEAFGLPDLTADSQHRPQSFKGRCCVKLGDIRRVNRSLKLTPVLKYLE